MLSAGTESFRVAALLSPIVVRLRLCHCFQPSHIVQAITDFADQRVGVNLFKCRYRCYGAVAAY